MKLSLVFNGLATLCSVLAAPTIAKRVYDRNRAGAVLKAPAGDSWKSVTGTFTVPSLTGTSKLSIWVAIGDTVEQDIILQGGITYNQGLSSWVAWFPGNQTVTTSQVPVAASDSITVTVTLNSATQGAVTIENKTQNKKVSKTVAAPAGISQDRFTAMAADWFVQAYQAAGELVKTPKYGTVAFTDCSATLASGGASVGTTGAGRFEIQGTSGEVFSKTTISTNGLEIRQQDAFGNPV